MKPDELLQFLREFHREKLTLRQRHVSVARHVSHYSFNNTYQYVIAREDVHLSWLETAIADLGGTADTLPEPPIPSQGRHKNSFMSLIERDASDAGAFVERWRPRVAEMTHARHRSMLQVILGETLEQKRFFDQMLAGRDDLLGRRADGAGTGDGVLGVRWIE